MIRRKGPILAAAVAAAFALGWYRGLFGIDQLSPTQTEAPAPAGTPEATRPADTAIRTPAGQPNAGSTGSSATDSPSASNGAAAPAANSPAAAPTASAGTDGAATPGFDVVRVEPDGSTVVAGKGAANEAIALTDGTRTLGEARTDANGDFVMTLSLPTGTHRLQLAQRDDAMSDDAAVVNVPPQGKPDELLVMMQRPGEASEILQRPDAAATPPVARPAETPEAAPSNAGQTDPEAQVAAVQPNPVPATPPQPTSTAPAEVSVEAVEIEGNRLFVAGSARAGLAVRMYLDDKLVAETRSGAGDRFIASASADVAVGDHTIRADVLDAAGRVVGRVEVPFQRPEGRSMAAIAAAPDATPQDRAPTRAPEAVEPPDSAESREAAVVQPPVTPLPSNATPAEGGSATPSLPGDAEESSASPQPSTPAAPDAEPQAIRQAPLQASPSRVIIRRGDTLWRISRDTYGRGSRYTVIYLANGDQIRDPDRIYPGQVFRVPDPEGTDAPPRG